MCTAPALRQHWGRPAALAAAALLAACASGPTIGPVRDGPEANPPAGLENLPDAEPRVEPLRSGGPNKPYEVLGRSYTPIEGDRALRETGLASWYGRKFHGRPTANGERYDMYAMTAAHKTMPLPSYARVRNPANGREIIVRINDRGPFVAGRIIDLSYSAALKLGVLGGVAPVEVERLTHDQIRAGTWQRGRSVAEPTAVAVDLPAAAEPPAVPRRADDDPLMALLTPPPALPAAPAAAATAGGLAATLPPPRPAPLPSSVPGPSARPVPSPATAPGAGASSGFWLQLGAFRQPEGAASLQQRVQRETDTVAVPVSVFGDGGTYRVQAGPYTTRAEALASADRLRQALQLSPLVVERR
jgi:rare lipoprotein A